MLRPSLFAAIFVLGCAGGDEERLPRIGDDCSGTRCLPGGASVGAGQVGAGGGADGDAGAPGDAGAEGTLAGAVRVLQDELFSSTTPFIGTGIVGARGAAGRVTSEFTDDSYQLEGLPPTGRVWIDMEATATTQDVMSTLHSLDLGGSPHDIAFVQFSTMEGIAQGLLVPENLDPGRGHAVLIFEDDSGSGVSGVRIVGPPGSVVAYDTGSGVFRDDFDATSDRGVAAVLNAEAIALPGAVVTLSYDGAASGTVDVKLAQDATTVLTVLP